MWVVAFRPVGTPHCPARLRWSANLAWAPVRLNWPGESISSQAARSPRSLDSLRAMYGSTEPVAVASANRDSRTNWAAPATSSPT